MSEKSIYNLIVLIKIAAFVIPMIGFISIVGFQKEYYSKFWNAWMILIGCLSLGYVRLSLKSNVDFNVELLIVYMLFTLVWESIFYIYRYRIRKRKKDSDLI